MAILNLSMERRMDEARAQQMRGRVLLEAQIDEKTLGDAVLFPDLQQVHTYAETPSWAKELTFPEKLLNPTKHLRDYDVEKLSPKHPLFQSLSGYITNIANSLKDPKLQPIASSLNKIKLCYERYIQNCILVEGKHRRSLLKGPARLSGFLQGNPVCKEIDRKVARRLVSINRYNEETRKNAFGASSVYFDREGNIFYKREYKNPLRPGNEFAFDAFNTLFLGGRATPTKLLKLGDIAIKDLSEGQIHLIEWLEAKNAQPDLLYSDFIRRRPDYRAHPFKDEKRDFLVQASLGIKGEELHTFLQNHPAAALGECIDPYNYGAMVLSALILRTNDGRADNYMLEQKEGVLKREVVGIDNDGILAPPLRKTNDGKYAIALRSVLFLFPEIMRGPLDPKLVKQFKDLNLEKLFVSYLQQLEKYNQDLTTFTSSHILSERELQELSLPIKLSLSKFLSFYRSAREVQDFLDPNNPQQSASDLFKLLFPIVHDAYATLLAQGESPLQVQNRLFDPRNVPLMEDILGKSSEEIAQSSQALPGMEKEGPPLPIVELLDLFLDHVMPSIDEKRQKQLLMHTHKTFPNFKKTSFKGIKFSDATLADVVSKGDMKEILLEESEEITPEGIVVLLSDNPNLKVIIGRNRQFTPDSLADLIQKAHKMKRALYYRIQEQDYPLSMDNLKNVFRPAIASGHFVLAEALVKNAKKFSVDVKQTDKEGNTLLHEMAKGEKADSVRFLVETGGLSLDLHNHKGQSPFHVAADAGHIKVLETLIHLEGDRPKGLAQRDKEKRTPFNVATYKMNEAVPFLLNEILSHRLPANEKVHLEKDPEGYTLLHIAAKFGLQDDVIRLIEQHAIAVDVRGDFQRTPLHMASYNGKVAAARALLECGADINAQTNEKDSQTTPLLDAVMHGDFRMVRLLTDSEHLNVNLKNGRGLSPIEIALIIGDLPILRLLMGHRSCQNIEASLDAWIENAKKNRQFHLLPFLYSEKSLFILRKMDPEARALETGRIITRLQQALNP